MLRFFEVEVKNDKFCGKQDILLDFMALRLSHLFLFLQARIDSHNKVLHARHADQRNASFQRALQTGSDFQRETRALLLRANLMRQDFVLKGTRK